MFVLKQYLGSCWVFFFYIYSTGHFEQKLPVVAPFIRKKHLISWYIFTSVLENGFYKCWEKSLLPLLSQNLCLTHVCLRIILIFYLFGGFQSVYINYICKFLFSFFKHLSNQKQYFTTMDQPMVLGCHHFQHLRNKSLQVKSKIFLKLYLLKLNSL